LPVAATDNDIVRNLSSRLWLPILLLGGAAWLAFRHAVLGDYPTDAAPAVEALAHGHVAAYLHAKPIMGPFATAFEAPFTLFGRGEFQRYEWACFGCLLVVACLGWYLADVARRRGATALTQGLIGLLCVVNPLTLQAIQLGHPEELLTAALAIGAVAMAIDKRALVAAICLGLAVASKQWAVLAIFPVLMALPERRIRACVVAACVAGALFLPALVAAPGAFMEIQGHAASGGRLATIWSVWFPLSPPTPRSLGSLGTVMVHEQPRVVQHLTHLLIVASTVAVPVGLWIRRGRFGLDGAEPFALLTLLVLLRCSLDPVDNLYYHLPLLLALVGWDAFDSDRLPLRAVAAAGVTLLFWYWSRELGSLALFNSAYLATMLTVAAAIAVNLFRREPAARPELSRAVPLRT
jgi:Glycosyltransferase family 87